jgi:hypothetical protein
MVWQPPQTKRGKVAPSGTRKLTEFAALAAKFIAVAQETKAAF